MKGSSRGKSSFSPNRFHSLDKWPFLMGILKRKSIDRTEKAGPLFCFS